MLDAICCTILNYILFQLVDHPAARLKKTKQKQKKQNEKKKNVPEWITELKNCHYGQKNN